MMPVTAEVAGRHDNFESSHLSFISAFHSRARRMGDVDKRATSISRQEMASEGLEQVEGRLQAAFTGGRRSQELN